MRSMMILVLVAFMVTAGIGGCAMGIESRGEHGAERGTASRNEHGAEDDTQDNVQAGEPGGEEAGALLTLDETYDTVRKGTRLIMSYHAPDNTFVGTVENTTGEALSQVRVEVHLSNGVELGPTTPVDLLPGQVIEVSLRATTEAFDGWTPHAEVGGAAGEHGAEDDTQDNVQAGELGGEEAGALLTLDETYDTVRKGTRLIMSYHAPDNTFVGTVENTTGEALSQVRVEVHLSNGVELGPTTPVDLLPGQVIEVSLRATTEAFDGWTPHAEVGGAAGEHGAGSESESEGEHGESGGG